MRLTLLSSFIALALPTLIYLISTVLNMRTINDREKSSPFECGFDPNHSARIPFSMRFFLLAIIFIVFDIEIVLLVPMPLLIMTSNSSQFIIVVSLFMFILIMGLLYEWLEGSLDWSK